MLNFPSLRFKEFSGLWKMKKLGQNGKFYSGGTPSTSESEFYAGKIPFIKSGEINKEFTEQHITKKAIAKSSAKIVKKGTLLFALYGATSGEVALSKIEGAINQAVLAIETNDNNVFLYNLFIKNKKRILNTYLQGGQGNLSAQIIKQLEFSIPSLDEQKKIASFLSKVDKKIDIFEDYVN